MVVDDIACYLVGKHLQGTTTIARVRPVSFAQTY